MLNSKLKTSSYNDSDSLHVFDKIENPALKTLKDI